MKSIVEGFGAAVLRAVRKQSISKRKLATTSNAKEVLAMATEASELGVQPKPPRRKRAKKHGRK